MACTGTAWVTRGEYMAATDASLPIARRATWRDDCLEIVCGIANAGGGRLVLDADVDGRGVVKRKTNRLMKTIPGIISSALDLTCAMELVLEEGRMCLEVVIPPSPEPLSYRGTFYLYQNGLNTVLDDEALDRLLQPEADIDQKWETRPVVQASLDDLNMGLVTRYTGALRDTDITTDLDEVAVMEEKLRHAGLMTGVGTPTNAGILLLHDQPHRYIAGATIRIGFFGGRRGTPLFEDEVTGSLIDQVHTTVDLIFDKYLADSAVTRRHGGDPLPREAVHEAVLNAVAHKNYDSGTPIQISVFADRLCIDNVGRPPRTWTVAALLGRHTSRPNNPNLVGALRSLGIIDGWGNGVGAMRMECIEAGLPEPVFELRDDETMVCFQMDEDSVMRTSLTSTDLTSSGSIVRAAMSDARAGAREAALQQEVGLTLNDEKVLSMIDIDGRLTAPRIAKSLNISESTVRRSFKRLRDLGIIDRVGSDKSGFWRVL